MKRGRIGYLKWIVLLTLLVGLLLCACGQETTTGPADSGQTDIADGLDGDVLPSGETEEDGEISPAPSDEVQASPEASGETVASPSPAVSSVPAASPSPVASSPAASPSVKPSSTPAPATATPTPAPSPSPSPSQAPAEPYSTKTAQTVLTVTGNAAGRAYYFTLAELKAMQGGLVEADYFSKGKEPQEMTNHFKGINVNYLLTQVVEASGAKKAVFRGGDGYAGSHSMNAIKAKYMDETVPGKVLSMILAWEEDGAACNLRLVMGQSIEGEYNRTFWVRNVVTIEVN